MMESDDISGSQLSMCIHCCGPIHQSRSNKDDDEFQHSSSSLANSAYDVPEALSSIFKLNYLKPFDTMEWLQNVDSPLTLLCMSCEDLLTDLYHLYQDFVRLGQLDSVLSQKLHRLDEIIDRHERKSIKCDLIIINGSEASHDGDETGDNNVISNPPASSSSANSQLCSKELKIKLTRLPENECRSSSTTTTRSTTEDVKEEDEFNDWPSDQEINGYDDDYNPKDWLKVKMEEDEFNTPGIKIKALEDIIESDDDHEKPLMTYNRRNRRKPDPSSFKINQSSSSSSSTRNRSNKIPKAKRKANSNHKNSKILVTEKGTYHYFRLKGKFPNPCWYCERTDFSTPNDCFEHTMKDHFSKINNNQDTTSMPVCTRCSKICFSHGSLEEHLKWCETIPSGARTQFPCPVCSKVFARKDGLQSHIVLHSDDRPYSCDQCEFKAKNPRIVYTHKKYKHNTGDGIKCDECDSYCKNDLILRIHKKSMHTMEGHKKYRERSLIALAKGREKTKAKLSQVSYICVDCGVDFFHNLALINHRRTVHGDIRGEFTCDTCGKNLRTKHGLEYHINTVHSDARPFICDTCGKSFKRLATLKSHTEQTHTEEGRLKYNAKAREKNRRRKLVASQLASKIGNEVNQLGQNGGESSNSYDVYKWEKDTPY